MNKTLLAMVMTALTTSAWWATALWGAPGNVLFFWAFMLSLGQAVWIFHETYETIKREK